MRTRLVTISLVLALALAGCREPRLGLPLSEVAPLGGARPEITAIAVAPVFRAATWSGGIHAPHGLALTNERSSFPITDLARLGTPGVAYPSMPDSWRNVSVPPDVLTRAISAIRADGRFTATTPTPDKVLSVRVIRIERGRPLVTELWIDAAAANALAAHLTDSAIGTDALRSVLQWEMNL